MLTVVQFPIADARPFAGDVDARLDQPDWPSPRVYLPRQFVRMFGAASERPRGADAAWVDEAAFCLARKAVRYPTLPAIPLDDTKRFVPRGAFRRLFSDGAGTVRVELGLASDSRRSVLTDLKGKQIVRLVQGILRLQTDVVEYGRGPVRAPLETQGQRLAQLFARSSSKRSAWASPAAGLRLVQPGRPLVLVETHPGEVRELPEGAEIVSPSPVEGVRLAFLHVASAAGPAPTWILIDDGAEMDRVRSLRLNLVRLHAAQETLDRVLAHLTADRITFVPYSPSGNRLETFLNKATRLVAEPSWHGIDRSAVVAAYRASVSVDPDDVPLLKQKLEAVKGQVAAKVEEYVITRGGGRVVINHAAEGAKIVNNEGIIIHGNVSGGTLVARIQGNVNDSFNTFAASGAPAEVQAAVADLKRQVDALLPKLAANPAAAEQAGDAFDTLTKQATRQSPAEAMVHGAAQVLISVGKTVDDLAHPIATAVNAVLGALKLVAIL